MDIFNALTPEWVQAGELGLAFVVVILSAGLVIYVVKSSTRREQEYLKIITTTLPVLQGIASSISTINTRLDQIGHDMRAINSLSESIAAINARLNEIEDAIKKEEVKHAQMG
jgi:hypothetical protein